MEQVREWLNGTRQYDAGVKLLQQYHRDDRLKRLFATEAASDFKKALLHKELQNLLTTGVVVQQVQEQQKEKLVQLVATAHTGWPLEMDEVLKALHAQWKPLFSEMNALSSRLYDIAKAGRQDEAGQMAHRILDLDDLCDALYDKRDHYIEHRSLPAEVVPAKVVVDPAKWPLALQNAQRQLRASRAKVAADPSNEKKAATLKKNEDLVAHYKQLLKLA